MNENAAASWVALLAGACALAAQDGVALRLELQPALSLRADTRVLPADLHYATVHDGLLDLRDLLAHVTFGPDAALGVGDAQTFAFTLELRTTRGAFGTVLMCRQGGDVHYSLTVGRDPGRVAFEPWSWTRDRLLSARRLDDGAWHVVEAAYDAATRQLALRVDGAVDAVQAVSSGFAGTSAPSLRLGHNLDPGVDQPFGGEIRRFELVRRTPAWFEARLAMERATTVLAPGEAARALSTWLAHERRARPPQAASAEAWSRAAATIRARVQDAVGLWPPPYAPTDGVLAGRLTPLSGAADATATDFAHFRPTLPLAVREGGTLTRAGHTVTRLYWQTFAGYFASGYLYRPRDAAPGLRRPAMLCPHGHWQDGARHPVVQARCIALAQQGYVVLAVDSVHLYDDRIGLSPLSVMTWNNLRGLELLRARDDVDAARIGCTGASGGGQQTYYLTALDSGLAAAAPAVMACHFEDILGESGVHCACNHTPHLLRAADMPQMAAAFAPRPQFFLTVTGDWTARFREHGFPAVADVYRLFDAEAAVSCQRWDKGHAYDQEMRAAAFAFFADALGVPSAKAYAEPTGGVATESLADLANLDRSDVPRDTAAIVAEFHARLQAPRDRPPAAVVASLRALLEHDEAPVAGEPRRVRNSVWAQGGERAVEQWVVPTDGDLKLPVLVLRAESGELAGERVAVLLGDGRGKADVLVRHAAWIQSLLAAGVHVVLADVRYVGELDQGHTWRELYGRFFGLDEGVLAVRDTRRLVAAVPALGLPSARVAVVGLGDRGAVAMLAAAVDVGITVAGAPELGPTYREAARKPALSRVLLHADLDDVCRVVGGRGLVGADCDSSRLVGALSR